MKIQLNINYIEDAPQAKITEEITAEAMSETYADIPEKAFGFAIGQHMKYHQPFSFAEFLKAMLQGFGTIPIEEESCES